MSRKEYIQELLEFSVKELVQKRKLLKKDLFEMKMKNLAGSLKKSSEITHTRRDIARINTILSHKITTLYGSSMK